MILSPQTKKYLFHFGLLLFNVLFVFFIIHYFGFRYETNDDIAMCSIANGQTLGIPNCHLVHINALYGCVLVGLYTLIPSIEWYTWSFLFLHVCSVTIIASCMIQRLKNNKIVMFAFLLCLYAIWSYIVQFLQYTTTAAFVSTAGCMLLFLPHGKWHWREILAGLFILIGSLLRFKPAGLVVLVFGPLFIWNYRLDWKRYIILVAIGVIVLLARGAEYLFYQAPEWKYYKQFNVARELINDNPKNWTLYNSSWGIPADSIPDGQKIAREDVELLLSFCIDPQIWTLDRLHEAKEIIGEQTIQNKLSNVKAFWKNKSYLKRWGVLFFSICIFALLMWRKRNGIFSISYWVILNGVWVTLLFSYVTLDAMLKDRAFLAGLIPMFCTMSIYFSVGNYHEWGRWKWLKIIVLLLPMMYLVGKYGKRVDGKTKWVAGEERLAKQVQLIKSVSPTYAVMPFCADYSVEHVNPFAIKKSKAATWTNGWMSSYPLNKYRSFEDFIDQPAGFFFHKNNAAWAVPKLVKTFEKNYGTIVTPYVVCENEENIIIAFRT